MDITVVLLLIVIIIAAAAAIWLIVFKIPEHKATLYERKLKAESEYDARIMSAAKSFVIGRFLYVTRGVNPDGVIIYDVKMIHQSAEQEPIAGTAIPIDASTHRLAVEWVMMSLNASPDGDQLLPESKVRASGLISDPGRWVDVGNYLRDNYGVMKINNAGSKNGTYTASGTTLKDLMLALSIASLAPAPPREAGLSKSA